MAIINEAGPGTLGEPLLDNLQDVPSRDCTCRTRGRLGDCRVDVVRRSFSSWCLIMIWHSLAAEADSNPIVTEAVGLGTRVVVCYSPNIRILSSYSLHIERVMGFNTP